MKKIGFLSFGHWMDEGSLVKTASDAYLQSIELAVEAEKIGIDGAWFRVHHFADQIGSPFPLMAAIGAKTSKIEVGTGLIDMRYENPYMMAENAGLTDIITQSRVQLGVGRGSPEQVLDGWKYFGYDYSEEEIKEITRQRTLEFLKLLEGKPFAEPNPMPMFPQGPGKLRIEPYSDGLRERIWWGSGSTETAVWAAKQGMNLQSSTLVNFESKEPFHIQQAKQLRAFKEAWKEAGHDFEPRTLVTRSIQPITTDLDRQLFGELGDEATDQVGFLAYHRNPTIFGKTFAGEPDKIVKQLAEDEAIKEADTVLVTIPNTLGVEYNLHLLESIVKDVAPDLGWR
ncbi:LLM class flavin-dependent oxidoreductase [Enterococcus durans]|uniref:LLM class flavin-dependent oxidoreductase n=1 Tax=Enterococcus durans TaxID=53345 RepID=A0A5N0Z015_9ENTE|nr:MULTISPECIES: LLM class flavin-dependent oxidoreductase [Enterococcus]KAA9179377.1 LLM class flavin-dependent oxidoreductase [Enterococcus durans]KAA9185718.1 LLM class flavin-dependent oxidoreductase [Enterococcus durans]KAA9186482.1 LLM class flavin-dependent oxidoreductase [Enterococcus durans]KAA9190120.1 LLM class flavin-dependent oxidoreductase [Enterococcus durans]KAA9193584.1 LLM class flavin-dependent oxidoreductase [Enterococcus durans]